MYVIIVILVRNMMLLCFLLSAYCIVLVLAYTNNLYTIKNMYDNFNEANCGGFNNPPSVIHQKQKLSGADSELKNITINPIFLLNITFETIGTMSTTEKDPFPSFQKALYQFIYGKKTEGLLKPEILKTSNSDRLAHYPSGRVMRSELFLNKSGVHIPITELIHRGHCRLRITKDYMQTAVDAFSIMLYGTLEDVLHLPSTYVLHSARTISMMTIAKEKLAATWEVVKGKHQPSDVTHETLELYRPLFKHINGREIARLNLSDERILHYVGTHAELNRHQVGVVASKYIHLNPNWKEPKYLNLMNNLLCGVPMTFMRKLPVSTYLQLSHQLFYHIRACDPLQRRFYLAFMTKTQALGKSYSWNARDVSRLGLLLAEVHENDLSAIKPEAMAGITAQVMLAIPAHKLKYITELQLSHIGQKSLNIYAKKLKMYNDHQEILNKAAKLDITDVLFFIVIIKKCI